jgi:hypothetical protein
MSKIQNPVVLTHRRSPMLTLQHSQKLPMRLALPRYGTATAASDQLWASLFSQLPTLHARPTLRQSNSTQRARGVPLAGGVTKCHKMSHREETLKDKSPWIPKKTACAGRMLSPTMSTDRYSRNGGAGQSEWAAQTGFHGGRATLAPIFKHQVTSV